MARSRSILERFRPVGTPGPAARPGVPADRVTELSAELQPVLSALDDTVEEARRIRTEASADAERLRREGTDRARSVLSQARRDAEAERADAAARVTERADRESADRLAAAEGEAAEVRRRGREVLPAQVEQVLDVVRASFRQETP